MTDDKAIEFFSRLMWSGKIREASSSCFITHRMESGGAMMTNEHSGKTMLEVMKMKHLNQADPHPDAFVECEDFPALIVVTVTSLMDRLCDKVMLKLLKMM